MFNGGECLRGLLWGQGRMIWDGGLWGKAQTELKLPQIIFFFGLNSYGQQLEV